MSICDTAARIPEVPERFIEWLDKNQHVWEAFEAESLKIIHRGFQHYSARTILHFLRHHSAITEKDGEWKLNNDHSPYLARLFAKVHPEYANLFEYRKVAKCFTNEASCASL